jgi:murein DD-endopeptidase MepM/ murein hydrolase activator NlpD
LARASHEPLIVYSRDLKYMLDSRYAAAPLRRSRPKRRFAVLLAAALPVVLAAAYWSGTAATSETAGRLDRLDGTRASAAQPNDPPGDREYTQPAQQVSKAMPAEMTARENPHPPANRSTAALIEWKTHNVSKGDSLGRIFSRFSVDIGLASRIVEHEIAGTLKKLMPGHEMRLGFDREGGLVRVQYELNRMEELLIRLEGSDLVAVEQRTIPTLTRERTASQAIGSSLFLAASEVGLSDRLIMDLVSIFGWDIDFALDIRAGDRFSIMYEELRRDGRTIGTGDILAAEFRNDGRVHHAIRHIDDHGRKQYFDLDGNNLRGTFLRTPMRVSRVTSGFSKRRYHPVLKKWRAHRGVDYGAPTGTPVLATGDGRVHSIGRNGGYGNAVILKHGGQYSTLYAHLSGFKKGLKKGSRVAQGEEIGYVGATGLATGPHLHYEFRVNGQHRDPLNYETPRANPIPDQYRENFLAMARDRINQLADARSEQVASR